jgi:hypothetical protein
MPPAKEARAFGEAKARLGRYIGRASCNNCADLKWGPLLSANC